MACGVPFLASDVGGNHSLGPTGAGWLFEAGSVSSLTSCITVLKNPDELKRRGNIASQYAREHYSWAATAECLEKIITAQLPARS
jgi:glycosyltransferase involved in cell wall biosynthesis